jgi:7-carboxy-7-deazaguanine synthase
VRVSGCNLRCAWCDTPYASWNPDGAARTIDDLIAEARTAHTENVRHAVLTGGEPMMFPQLTELSSRLAGEADMHITIETAGTIIPPGGVTCNLMSISPKLASSTPRGDARDPTGAWTARHEERRLNLPVLQELLDQHDPARDSARDRQLKFVVTAGKMGEDIAEIEGVLGRLRGWRPDEVLLMPEGVTRPHETFVAGLAAECLKRGWRYCARLHIELFGNRRGT